MTAYLRKKNNAWYCSNCMMRQNTFRHTCSFCGMEFANYMEVVYSNWKVQEDEKSKYDYYDDYDYGDVYREVE